MKEGLALLLLFATSSSALVCLRCEGENDMGACQRNGELMQCTPNQVCFVMIRNANDDMSITKGCKQNTACNTLYMENHQSDYGEARYRCNPSNTSLCCCCCEEDRCNDGMEWCVGGYYGVQNLKNLDKYNRAPPKRPSASPTIPRRAPTVLPSMSCPPLGKLDKGRVTCTRGYGVGSVCTFSCGEKHQLKPSDRKSTTCQMDLTWNKEMPCCARTCDSKAKYDLVGLAHAKSNETYHAIYDMFALVFGYWPHDRDGVRHAHFDFSGNVDPDKVLNFRDGMVMDHHPTRPHIHRNTPDGQSNMGLAMNYAYDNLRSRSSGYRSDVQDVIVIATDSSSTDFEASMAAAERWRKSGALTYIVVFEKETPSGDILDVNPEEMAKIAGTSEHVYFFDEDKPEETRDSLLMELMNHICPSPCSS